MILSQENLCLSMQNGFRDLAITVIDYKALSSFEVDCLCCRAVVSQG